MSEEAYGMSIGALSQATGVPADTLRTWERRYGFPTPDRTETGHRRYSMKTLDRLRHVVRLLELGHRPSTALTANDAILHELLATAVAPSASAKQSAEPEGTDSSAVLESWFGMTERYDGRALARDMDARWAALGGMVFLEQLVAPFLYGLGERWADGRLGPRHEHFASARVSEFLAARWRPLSDAATGPLVVCATTAGERHALGLTMAALVMALHNTRVVFLGVDLPAEEIASTATHHRAAAVLLSAAAGTDRAQLDREVAALNLALPASMPIVGGGAGFAPAPPGSLSVDSLGALAAWAATRR
jgi:methylmalonyl-CoA mutase cobalamin-binding subunit